MHKYVNSSGINNAHNSVDDWSYNPTTPIVNTTDVVIKTAVAGIRYFITDMQIKNSSAVATEVVIKDGATVIWRGHVSASPLVSDVYQFSTPLHNTAGNALNVACVTTSSSVYVNVQGYQSA